MSGQQLVLLRGMLMANVCGSKNVVRLHASAEGPESVRMFKPVSKFNRIYRIESALGESAAEPPDNAPCLGDGRVQ